MVNFFFWKKHFAISIWWLKYIIIYIIILIFIITNLNHFLSILLIQMLFGYIYTVLFFWSVLLIWNSINKF